MTRTTARARIRAAHVVTPEGVLGPAEVRIVDGRIDGVEAVASAPEVTLAPGFVDLQVNGHGDVDVGSARAADWDRIDALLLAEGVTTWCPTLTTRPLDDYGACFDEIGEAAQRPGPRPAMVGVHLEGPFIAAEYAGAHRADAVRAIDVAWLAELPELVRIVTLAPELAGAIDAVELLVSRGIVVAVGHSGASASEARAALDAGASLVTHVFNAMRPLGHRDPGLIGVALTDPRATVSVIADGVHLDDAILALILRAKAPDGVALVTDAVASSDSRVQVSDGAPRLADGTLAGSILTMDRAVARAVGVGASLPQAVAAASTVPARVVGLTDRGIIAPGTRADLVCLNPDHSVDAVWIAGEPAWEAGP
ncbi:MAG TPA: amidohydrolase family protein [Acidimicrobiia bacterium]|nr:amidohydrolase family protein [Acidimicrobiia bacterium]